LATDFSLIERSFFSTAIADTCRAIRGGSYMGAFTLSMCAIDAMAYLRNALPSKGSRANFMTSVQDWIVPLNKACRPDVIWALRCGLVHTYGYANAMRNCGMRGYWYTNDRPADHWGETAPDYYTLNLDSHVAETTVAAFNFFESMPALCAQRVGLEQEFADRAGRLNLVHKFALESVPGRPTTVKQSILRPPAQFGAMDQALAPLDQAAHPAVTDIAGEIRKIYPT